MRVIPVTVESKGQTKSATGAGFPGNEIRLTRFNTYRLEAELEGINLVVQNKDTPGVIRFIGTTLGAFRINIANMHLSRRPERDKPVAIIRLDTEAPEAALQALRANPMILSVEQVQL